MDGWEDRGRYSVCNEMHRYLCVMRCTGTCNEMHRYLCAAPTRQRHKHSVPLATTCLPDPPPPGGYLANPLDHLQAPVKHSLWLGEIQPNVLFQYTLLLQLLCPAIGSVYHHHAHPQLLCLFIYEFLPAVAGTYHDHNSTTEEAQAAFLCFWGASCQKFLGWER